MATPYLQPELTAVNARWYRFLFLLPARVASSNTATSQYIGWKKVLKTSTRFRHRLLGDSHQEGTVLVRSLRYGQVKKHACKVQSRQKVVPHTKE